MDAKDLVAAREAFVASNASLTDASRPRRT
jgi:hypothetical protein